MIGDIPYVFLEVGHILDLGVKQGRGVDIIFLIVPQYRARFSRRSYTGREKQDYRREYRHAYHEPYYF
jgi:hypothetical protein